MTVALQEITATNWRQVIKLKVAPEQEKFVASNVYSIAQSKMEPFWNIKAIFDEETLVGFTMYGLEEEGNEFDGYWICRLMIDQQFQQNGYGRAALKLILKTIGESGYTGPVFISFEVHNTVAEKLYASLGFEDTGRMDWGEKIYRLATITE